MKKIKIDNLETYKIEIASRIFFCEKTIKQLDELKRLVDIEKEYSYHNASWLEKQIAVSKSKRIFKVLTKDLKLAMFYQQDKKGNFIVNDIDQSDSAKNIYFQIYTINKDFLDLTYGESLIPMLEYLEVSTRKLVTTCLQQDKLLIKKIEKSLTKINVKSLYIEN